MKKSTSGYLILYLLLFCMTLLADDDGWNDTNARFMNTSRTMTAFGFSNGTLIPSAKIITQLNTDIAQKTGAFEEENRIDTSEEFLTAAFYSGLKVKDSNKQEIIQQELSAGKGGALKLGAMWLKKRVDKGASYNSAIQYITEQSTVSEEEILNYYRQAISAEIDRISKSILSNIPKSYYNYVVNGDDSPGEKVNAIDLIKAYYMYPSDENYQSLLGAVRYFGRKGTESEKGQYRFRIFIRIIDSLSPSLRERITEDIFKKEGDI